MAATDTFARFLDAVAETLGEPGVSGDALARRLHLSRYHLDRLVSAAAGEPPAALRRRLLLERAAHRLLTSEDEVMEVALDSGYSSHEAFTRAFRRAYGDAPTAWRRRTSQFLLDAPSGVHFQPPAGLRLRAREETSMDLVIRMIEHHVWLLDEIIVRAQNLPEETLDKPILISVDGIDDSPTLRSLLSRLVGQLDMWVAAVEGRPYDMAVEDHECLKSMGARLAEAGPAFLVEVRGVAADGRLGDTFVDAICDPPEVFTYGGMVAHVLAFGAHRRTLACGALADAGISDLGAGDPMRWVAA